MSKDKKVDAFVADLYKICVRHDIVLSNRDSHYPLNMLLFDKKVFKKQIMDATQLFGEKEVEKEKKTGKVELKHQNPKHKK